MKKFLILVSILSLLILSLSDLAKALNDKDLEEINKAIQTKGAKWIAGETSISRLTLEERKNLLGLLKREIPSENLIKPPTLKPGELPDSFDWRDYNGYNWMTSIKNQPCGNCWAYSTLGIIEPKLRLTLNQPDIPMDLAEMFLTWCGRGACEGWSMNSSFNFVLNKGVPDEGCIPAGTGACSDTCSNRYLRSIHITNWGAYISPSVSDIKEKIYNSGPISVTMTVYTDFSYYNSGVYRHVTGELEGYHAVLLCGWNDADSSWIGKNSWGTDWGEAGGGQPGGWFRIRTGHNEVDIEEAAYFVNVDTNSIHWLILNYPNGGEKWMEGTNHYINWVSPYFSDSLKIEYTPDNGSHWTEIVSSYPDVGNYYWQNLPNIASKNYRVKVSDKATGTKTVTSAETFTVIVRGDANGDVSTNVSDVIFLINYLFKGGPSPNPFNLGDVTCDGDIMINDVIYLINYLFKGGPHWTCP